jgi:hypothetical protein
VGVAVVAQKEQGQHAAEEEILKQIKRSYQ